MHATLSDIVADVAANSIEAGASRVAVDFSEVDGRIVLRVEDNGKGMDEATKARAFNPFFTEPGKHDKRKVGLGLPILKQICESTDGAVSLKSEKGVGTELSYSFSARHIDLPPMGDLVEAVLMLFNYPGDFDLTFTHQKGAEEYTISRSELADAVGGLESVDGLSLAREFLASQEESLVPAS